MTNEHSYDGTRQSDSSASYYGTVFSCSCGQPFVHKQDLLEHIAQERTKQALKTGITDLRKELA
jgi:hypothetical protein